MRPLFCVGLSDRWNVSAVNDVFNSGDGRRSVGREERNQFGDLIRPEMPPGVISGRILLCRKVEWSKSSNGEAILAPPRYQSRLESGLR